MSTGAFRKRNRSAFENFLRAKYEMYTGAERVDSRPYYLCVDPSEVCQLRCPTCPTGIENERKRDRALPMFNYRDERKKMAPSLFDSLLEELGENLFCLMLHNYGEPLLNEHVPKFIRKAVDLDIYTEMHTNLSLKLSDKKLDELLASGLDSLCASVDGFSQEAYAVHRVGGSVELVKSNLERLVQARDRMGLPTDIIYKFLIFSHNEHELEDARRFCSRIGVTFLPCDAFVHDASWLPKHREGEAPYYTAAQMDALAQEWSDAGHEGYFGEHELRPFWNVFREDDEVSHPASCAWHYGFSVVSSGGPVAPCCAVAKECDDFGVVEPGDARFSDVWNNEKYRSARRASQGGTVEVGNESVCTRCYFPKAIRHLYSEYDFRVLDRFREVIGTSDPAMSRAFELLGPNRETRHANDFIEHMENTPIGVASALRADGQPQDATQ